MIWGGEMWSKKRIKIHFKKCKLYALFDERYFFF